ncbi:MAG: Mur ligase family protein, partial [Deltaproteobacteria bacterium]
NRVFDRLWPHVLDVGTGCEWGLPSYFEAQVAISLLAFADERVDVAVVEVGLGGTLDATNVLPAETVVITNVGLDHTEILGNTVEEIAKDKAGIIKEGTRVVVTGATQESVRRIIERRCRAVGSDLIVVDTNHEDAQRANFQVADAALKTFGVGLPNGLSGTTIAGRFERVQSDPTVVLDGAHNSEKMLALSRWIARQKRPEQRSVVVLGVKLGKDLRSILRAVDPRCSILIATEFRMSSGLWSSVEAAVLADVWREAESERNCTTIVEPDPLRAVETAIALAISQGIDDVVVTGSLYLVGNVREKWVPSEWLIKAAEQNLVRGDLRPNR